MANAFNGNWDEYLTVLEAASPAVAAIGITEYCTIEAYRRFREYHSAGRAPGIRFVFPNVEFRLDVQTERKSGINIHLLFSPDDVDHEAQIERVLGELWFEYKSKKYRCTPDGLRSLGRAHDPRLTDDVAALRKGAEQFKVNREQLAAVVANDAWAKRNCLIAVSGREGDGTAGLQNDGAFLLLREEIEAMADIIFSSRPKDRDFWIGSGKLSPDEIEEKYRTLKPCLHGCDAHTEARVARPDENRFCWIKAGLSFTGLKQTLLEPELRVHIGPEPPMWAPEQEVIDQVQVSDSPWLLTPQISLNGGLVAIIGPKGSGKTALADLISIACGAAVDERDSFVAKAGELLAGDVVDVHWADGSTSGAGQLDEASFAGVENPVVRYLSQQFVERLCASHGVADELLREIESVVFQAVPAADRLGARGFAELRDVRVEQVVRLRDAKLQRIAEISEAIAADEEQKASAEGLTKVAKEWTDKIDKGQKALAALLPREKKEAVARLSAIQRIRQEKEKELEGLRLGQSQASQLPEEVAELRARWLREYEALKGRYLRAGLTDPEWAALAPVFRDDTDTILSELKARISNRISLLLAGPVGFVADEAAVERWPLQLLRTTEAALTKEIGIEKERTRQYTELQKSITKWQREGAAADVKVKNAQGADERIRSALEERRRVYAQVFDLFVREKETLEALYAPLKGKLAQGAAGRLEFYVRRVIDLDRWIATGEALLDLRKTGAFQGKGALRAVVEKTLVPAWATGDAAAVATAMDEFRVAHARNLSAMVKGEVSRKSVGEWLYSTSHISLAYGIRYEGVDLAKLSPGMKGVVLLMLYLVVDEWDERPLVVDQPEENLDPQSVYEELVKYFRAAKLRRQVILVTHNPNLVVNTDADQVIVASAVRVRPDQLPSITYASGGLEDPEIRAAVCRILEGGERAFRERERRYGLPRDRRTGV